MWRILDGRSGILQKRYSQVHPECHQPKAPLMYTTNRPERCTQDLENRKSFLQPTPPLPLSILDLKSVAARQQQQQVVMCARPGCCWPAWKDSRGQHRHCGRTCRDADLEMASASAAQATAATLAAAQATAAAATVQPMIPPSIVDHNPFEPIGREPPVCPIAAFAPTSTRKDLYSSYPLDRSFVTAPETVKISLQTTSD